MMIKLAVFIVVNVALVQGCCFPAQWQGYEGLTAGYVVKGEGKKIEGGSKLFYDGENRKVAAFSEYYVNGKPVRYQFIMDFEKKRQYIIYKGRCKTSVLKYKFRKACIPEDAKLVLDTHFGAGKEKLEASIYQMNFKNISLSTTVTKKGCVPIGVTMSGVARGVPFLETLGFIGIEAGIKDPKVFKPPKTCKRAPSYNETIYHDADSQMSFSMARRHKAVSILGF